MKNFAVLTIALMVVGLFAGTADAVLSVSMDANPPTVDVAVSQANEVYDNREAWRWYLPAGEDNEPHDTGQTFLAPPGGLLLDKVTVKLDPGHYCTSNGVTAHNGEDFTLKIYGYADGVSSNPVPWTGPGTDVPIHTEGGNFPADMATSWNAGILYLTIDLTDFALTGGQYYGFMLEHDNPTSGTENHRFALCAAYAPIADYPDGWSIGRQLRTTGGDEFIVEGHWDGAAYVPGDMVFFLQGGSADPPGTLIYGK
jgi:hypothetical protein